MRYDDRLTTVMDLSVDDPHARAVQWRQLVELLARGAGGGNPVLRKAALEQARWLGAGVPEPVRAAGARAIAAPDLPLDVVMLFSADTLEAAAPILTSATLNEQEWADVRALASPEVTTMLNAFRETRLPEAPLPAYVPPSLFDEPRNMGQARELGTDERGEAPHPEPSRSSIFQWECSAAGEIDWVEGVPRAALIGYSIAEKLGSAFAARLPFADEPLGLGTGPIGHEHWEWTGAPIFAAESGRFSGYRGVARLLDDTSSSHPEESSSQPALNSDGLRELVHELRTPLSAIMGFGEIIEGQFLGPAHQVYRERAGIILDQARRLLEAVEDLDFTAKLQSGRATGAAHGSPVAQVFPAARGYLTQLAEARGVQLRISMRAVHDRCALSGELAGRLIRRFGAAVISAASPGERIDLVIDRIGRDIAFAMDRPKAVADWPEQQLLTADVSNLGLGFALRLVRGLATIAKGTLDVEPGRFVLLIPADRR